MRGTNQTGSNRKGHVAKSIAALVATAAPTPIDTIIAASVTWLAVTPASASLPAVGRQQRLERRLQFVQRVCHAVRPLPVAL
jgi:hypothetical protein